MLPSPAFLKKQLLRHISPFIGIGNNTTNQFYALGGDYTSPQIVGTIDSALTLQNIPPVGWTVRFERKTSNTLTPNPPNKTDIIVAPNPSKDGYFCLNSDNPIGQITITDSHGKQCLNSYSSNTKSCVQLPYPGLFFLEVRSNEGAYQQKLLFIR